MTSLLPHSHANAYVNVNVNVSNATTYCLLWLVAIQQHNQYIVSCLLATQQLCDHLNLHLTLTSLLTNARVCWVTAFTQDSLIHIDIGLSEIDMSSMKKVFSVPVFGKKSILPIHQLKYNLAKNLRFGQVCVFPTKIRAETDFARKGIMIFLKTGTEII